MVVRAVTVTTSDARTLAVRTPDAMATAAASGVAAVGPDTGTEPSLRMQEPSAPLASLQRSAAQVQAGEWAGELRGADGLLLAEISYGVRILVPGIRDQLGLEVGGRGQDVLDRKPAPQPELLCMASGPTQLRCEFARRDDNDVDGTSYVIAGALGDDVVVRGEAARQRLAAATLLELHYSAWCH